MTEPEARGQTEARGQINISNDVLARIAGYAAMECYGVVGMCYPNLKDGVVRLLSGDRLAKGVVVDSSDGSVSVDLFVVIEYGTNLAEVSRNLVNKVRYVLETVAQVDVRNVAVHVQRIKVRKKT